MEADENASIPGNEERHHYLDLCIRYRFLSLAFSTVVYLFGIGLRHRLNLASFGIVTGMLLCCLLGNHLYRSFLENQSATEAILVLELFGYGIFIILSGGFASSYLWYSFSCILISMNGGLSMGITLLLALWCIICAAAGWNMSGGREFRQLQSLPDIRLLSVNILVGIIILIGDFYVLRRYVSVLAGRQKELLELNRELREENQRSETALSQISGMYESFGLMAMTDSERILRELGAIIVTEVSAGGCLLVWRNADRSIRKAVVSGMAEEQGSHLLRQLLELLKEEDTDSASAGNAPESGGDAPPGRTGKLLLGEGREYELLAPGEEDFSGGLLVLELPSVQLQSRPGWQEERNFYIRLSGIIFRALEMQSQLEEYISAEEKNRLADEIHDTVIQKLFGLSCDLRQLETGLGALSEKGLQHRLSEMEQAVLMTMRELREAIYGRKFERSGEQSFVYRLNSYLSEAERQYKVEIAVELDPGTEDLSAAQKIVMYRVSCEAVNNAVRHGKAKHIELHVRVRETALTVTVRDDGCGFSGGKGKTSPDEGKGIGNMRRMAALMQGRLTVKSVQGRGTELTLSLPRGQGEKYVSGT